MELKDRVEQISALVDELRQAVGDQPKSRQLLDSLFRTVHTFKAAASAAGQSDASRIAHQFEDLLYSLRTGRLTLDAQLLQVFDETTAALRGESHVSALTRLTKLPNEGNSGTDHLPAEFSALKDDERHRATAAMRDGSNLYVLEAAFAVTDFAEGFRQLKEQLDRMAEVIATSAAMDEDRISFRIFYAARSEKIRVHTIFEQAVLAGKATAAKLGKEVNFVVEADELLLNKSVSEVLADALLHLVRNAVDHGIESRGNVLLEVTKTANYIKFYVTDNGRGIDPANINLLFQPGFSTVSVITEFSGRGVGLDAVKTAVEDLGGSVSVTSEPGKGSSFEITLPNPSSDA